MTHWYDEYKWRFDRATQEDYALLKKLAKIEVRILNLTPTSYVFRHGGFSLPPEVIHLFSDPAQELINNIHALRALTQKRIEASAKECLTRCGVLPWGRHG